MNIFERAARAKLRFASNVGDLTTEQLFDLPLTAKRDSQLDLDKLARNVHAELKSMEEGSFVVSEPNPRKVELELKLEILKYIIESKIKARDAAEKAAITAERRKKLMAALDAKEDAALVGMTREQIQEELAKIEA